MTLFMALAAGYGVLQLAALGWLTGRSVRLGTLLLAIMAGLYGCGAVALVLQVIYTRSVASITGESLSTVVDKASYTIDPFIEELVKIAPLALLAASVRRRFQYGMTDYVLLGAGFGAGFGLLEALLRFSHLPERAITVDDGWLVPSGFSVTLIPDLGTTLTSWLPAPATTETLAFFLRPETFLHLAWSAIAGLGVAVAVRGKGRCRLLGLLPVVFVGAEHAALNYDLSLSKQDSIVAAPLLAAHKLLWLYPLICLAVAAIYDRRDIHRTGVELTDLKPADLARFATVRLPWTPLIAVRYLRLRRSVIYSQARGPKQYVEPWRTVVRQVRERIDRTDRSQAWQQLPRIRLASRVALVAVWSVLLLPSLLYLVVAGFPGPVSSLQSHLAKGWFSTVMLAVLAVGMLWVLFQLTVVLRGLPAAVHQPHGESLARTQLRVVVALGSLSAGVYTLVHVVDGVGLDRPAINNVHVLSALAGAVGMVLLVLGLAALITMFPPGGLALAGGLGAAGVTVTLSAETLATVAAIGGISGWMLASAADGTGGDGGGGDGGSGEGGGGEGGGNNAARFPGDDFEGTGYSMDDLASMAHRHTGSGDMHIGGSAPRPTEAEIVDTLGNGTFGPYGEGNSVAYVRDGIRVIVNRDMPWQSTAYYIGG
jgi:hypothetical protein